MLPRDKHIEQELKELKAVNLLAQKKERPSLSKRQIDDLKSDVFTMIEVHDAFENKSGSGNRRWLAISLSLAASILLVIAFWLPANNQNYSPTKSDIVYWLSDDNMSEFTEEDLALLTDYEAENIFEMVEIDNGVIETYLNENYTEDLIQE